MKPIDVICLILVMVVFYAVIMAMIGLAYAIRWINKFSGWVG